ncbi:MAG: hypothetical protein AAFQ57_11545, partial [Cyanobacteria bacterium J06626_14]
FEQIVQNQNRNNRAHNDIEGQFYATLHGLGALLLCANGRLFVKKSWEKLRLQYSMACQTGGKN